MILYLDTSALVKRYFEEAHSEELNSNWNNATEIVISAVAYAETLASFHRKRREAGLGDQHIAGIIHTFRADWNSFIRVAVSENLNSYIDRVLVSHPLKGFDAIHLASALFVQKRIAEDLWFGCFDRQLTTAAKKEGLAIMPADDS